MSQKRKVSICHFCGAIKNDHICQKCISNNEDVKKRKLYDCNNQSVTQSIIHNLDTIDKLCNDICDNETRQVSENNQSSIDEDSDLSGHNLLETVLRRIDDIMDYENGSQNDRNISDTCHEQHHNVDNDNSYNVNSLFDDINNGNAMLHTDDIDPAIKDIKRENTLYCPFCHFIFFEENELVDHVEEEHVEQMMFQLTVRSQCKRFLYALQFFKTIYFK